MAAPRFFVDLPLAVGARVPLPDAVAHHAARVLRLPEGAEVTLFNGRGGEHRALLGPPPLREARVTHFDASEREAPLDLTLIQALVATEKLDWIVEKSTELGAARILLLPAERSVVRLAGERLQRRVQHLLGVARAACEQCGRNRVPQLAPVSSFADALAHMPAAAVCLLLTPGANPPAARPAAAAFGLAVGPEGGFTAAEVAAAAAAGFAAAPLGPRTLRTETAGLAALAALLTRHGDFAGLVVSDERIGKG